MTGTLPALALLSQANTSYGSNFVTWTSSTLSDAYIQVAEEVENVSRVARHGESLAVYSYEFVLPLFYIVFIALIVVGVFYLKNRAREVSRALRT